MRTGRLFEGDKVIWIILLFLGMISVIEVYSASSNMSYESGHYWIPIKQHTQFFLLGIVFAFAVHKIPCRYFKLISVFGIPLSVAMLIVAMFFSERVNEAGRWLTLGGFQFQPSEVAKGALITTVAIILSNMRDERGATPRAFKWIMVFAGGICLLIMPENFSTAAMTFLVVLIMMFIGHVRWAYLGSLIGILFFVGISLFVFLRYTPEDTIAHMSDAPGLHRLPTWAQRVRNGNERPTNPKDYDITKDIQETHARVAIATCNVIGRGPGNSVERDFLPQAFSDFIYAIIIEELGLIGGVFVMFLYIVLLFRSARIASRCERAFPAFLVMGLSLMLVTQAMVNMAVAVGAFPVTGQPLPLISKGGTSTLINCTYVGIILSVSRSARKKSEEETGVDQLEVKDETTQTEDLLSEA